VVTPSRTAMPQAEDRIATAGTARCDGFDRYGFGASWRAHII